MSGAVFTVDGLNGRFSVLSAVAGAKLLESPEELAATLEAIRDGRAILCLAREADSSLQDNEEAPGTPGALNPNSPQLLDSIIVRLENLIKTDGHFAQHLGPLIDELMGLRRDVAEVFHEVSIGNKAASVAASASAAAAADAAATADSRNLRTEQDRRRTDDRLDRLENLENFGTEGASKPERSAECAGADPRLGLS